MEPTTTTTDTDHLVPEPGPKKDPHGTEVDEIRQYAATVAILDPASLALLHQVAFAFASAAAHKAQGNADLIAKITAPGVGGASMSDILRACYVMNVPPAEEMVRAYWREHRRDAKPKKRTGRRGGVQ